MVECKLWRNPQARREVVAQILDYAKEISRWSYRELDEAVRSARRSDDTLFDLVRKDEGKLDEATFVDDVTRNLANGRFLLVVVGDGIREGVERIAEYLRQFAGIQFTLGLVELAICKLPKEATPGGLSVEPRVLARTVEIERAIVRRADANVVVEEPSTPATSKRTRRRRITEDEFYREVRTLDPALPDRVREFLSGVEDLGLVVTVSRASLILHWHREDGGKVNFGTFFPDGTLNSNYICDSAESAGDVNVGVRYLEAVARLIPGAQVRKIGKSWTWRVLVHGGYPRFAVPLNRPDKWLAAIEETMAAFNRLAAD